MVFNTLNIRNVSLFLVKISEKLYRTHVILGKYKVINNGFISADTTKEDWNIFNISLSGVTYLDNKACYLLLLEDKDRCNLNGSILIKINPNNPNEMLWKLVKEEFWLEPDCYNYPNMPEFTLPLEMTLQKIE